MAVAGRVVEATAEERVAVALVAGLVGLGEEDQRVEAAMVVAVRGVAAMAAVKEVGTGLAEAATVAEAMGEVEMAVATGGGGVGGGGDGGGETGGGGDGGAEVAKAVEMAVAGRWRWGGWRRGWRVGRWRWRRRRAAVTGGVRRRWGRW